MAAIPKIAEQNRLSQLTTGQKNNNFTRASEYNALVERMNSLTSNAGTLDQTLTAATITTATITTANLTTTVTDTINPATSGAGTSIKVPAGIFTTATVAATSLKSGGVYGLSKADGQTVTLPALATVDIGTKFKFHIVTTCTSVGYVISKGEAGDVFVGGLWCTIANPDGLNDMEFNIASGTVNTLTLGATTACGLAGGYFEVTAISATQWAISGTCLGSGIIASNLFTTV